MGHRPAASPCRRSRSAGTALRLGRNVGAPAGATVRVEITGPSPGDVAVERPAATGARRVPASDATVALSVTWPDFMGLSCGRVDGGRSWLRDSLSLSGDPNLGEALLAGLSIAP